MQPIHTVYGGAHLFRRDTAPKLARIARKAFDTYHHLLPVTDPVKDRIAAKLDHNAVEDLRIDFEDGYGVRADEEETEHAVFAAKEVNEGYKDGTLPAFLGIRPRSFHAATRTRALRTLRAFFGALHRVPDNFAVTLPKIEHEEEIEALRMALDDLGVNPAIELMIETPQALANMKAFHAAAGPQCRGAHLGPYDLMSSCGLVSASQSLRHALCTHARLQMLIGFAGSGVWLSDGPTSTLPLGGEEEVGQAWKLQWLDVQNSLATGFFQGWDLHPAQFPIRYAALYQHFSEHLPSTLARLENFETQQQQATRIGVVFDDAATIRGLRAFAERARSCGFLE
ncbi:MAG: hypothetical protein JNK87_30960 [Bryobacterales bacterium]|nr:hypothetical protein [Bryobacterales bacterium]